MITDPPILTIRRNFERPSAALVEAFRGVPTGYLVDAMQGRGCLGHAIRPLLPERSSLTGVAVTCHAGPADNLAVFGALEVLREGDVIVACTDAFMKTSASRRSACRSIARGSPPTRRCATARAPSVSRSSSATPPSRRGTYWSVIATGSLSCRYRGRRRCSPRSTA